MIGQMLCENGTLVQLFCCLRSHHRRSKDGCD